MSEESRVAHLAFQVNLDEFEPLSDMETALPIKFAQTIEEALGRPPARPAGFEGLEDKPRRVQGCYVSDGEVERIGMYWADPRFHSLRPRQFIEEVEQAIAATTGEGDSGDDPLIDRARELAASSERISTSFLQRRLRIGYPRAARLMETLRDEGYGESDSDDDF